MKITYKFHEHTFGHEAIDPKKHTRIKLFGYQGNNPMLVPIAEVTLEITPHHGWANPPHVIEYQYTRYVLKRNLCSAGVALRDGQAELEYAEEKILVIED